MKLLKLKVILAWPLVLLGCDLPHIREYSSASAKVMEIRAVADSMPESKSRLMKTTGGQADTAEAERNRKSMSQLQDGYQAYFKALGALAADDLANYKKEFTAFGSKLATSQVVSKSDSAAISKVAAAVAGALTDAYRHAKLRAIIQAVNPVLQKNMKDFQRWADDAEKGLDIEKLGTVSTLDSWSPRLPEPLRPAIADYKEMRLEEIESDRKKIRAFVKSVNAVALGHAELTKNVGELRADALVKSLKTHNNNIKAAYNALNP